MKVLAHAIYKAADEFVEAIGSDYADLIQIGKAIEKGDINTASALADKLDTNVREELPPQFWEVIDE
jgi:hypothetical protein